MNQFMLRVPESLLAHARKAAEEEQVSMNQFFVTAIAEKVSALKTETYFRERQAWGNLAAFDAWLGQPGINPWRAMNCLEPAQPNQSALPNADRTA